MKSDHTVSHEGTVVGIEGQNIRVKIISQSACASCNAKASCMASDMKEKFIDTVDDSAWHYKVGDTVCVIMKERMGWLALLYGFILPFFVFMICLMAAYLSGAGEIKSALLGIGSLVPYYILLHLLRKKIEKNFVFRIEPKDK